MGWRDRRPEPRTETAALLKRIEHLESRVRSLAQTGPTSLQLIDFENYEDDLANVDIGEVHINWPGVHKEARRFDPAVYFHDEKWRALGSNAAVYEIKVFEDDEANLVKDRAFVWEIPEDLDQAEILKAGAFVTTDGAPSSTIRITDDIGGGNVFDGDIVIPAGVRSSKTGNNPQSTRVVSYGDQLAINVLSTGGMGMGVWVLVVGSGVGGVLIQGAKGDPGGITAFTGVYNNGATYTTGQAVSSSGSSYVAIQPVPPGIVPGVTPGWEAFWMLLNEGVSSGFAGVTIAAGAYVIQPGIKGANPIPFDGVIQSGTLLGNISGSAVVDVRKVTFPTYPGSVGNSITAGNPLRLTSTIKSFDAALTGWNKNVSAGDILIFDVSGVVGLSVLTAYLDIARA